MIACTDTPDRTLIRIAGDGDVSGVAHAGADAFQVLVRENATTGYVWEIAQADAPLLGDERFGRDPQRIGGGAERALTFASPEAGETASITLMLRRPWLTDDAPARTVRLTVLGTARG